MIKLTSKKQAADLYTRMPLRFEAGKPVVKTDEETPREGWIEFWHSEAKACKDPLRRITAEIYTMQEVKNRRSADQELSVDEGLKEIDRFNDLAVNGLALKLKDWFLVTDEGEEADAPVSVENARELFSDNDHDLREIALEYLGKPENFTLRVTPKPAKNSAPTRSKTSKAS